MLAAQLALSWFVARRALRQAAAACDRAKRSVEGVKHQVFDVYSYMRSHESIGVKIG